MVQQTIFKLLLLTSFALPFALQAESAVLPKTHAALKAHQKNGNLFFHFTTHILTDDVLRSLTGSWQISICTPDNRVIHGPVISASAPPSQIEILVESPILFGTYIMNIENINSHYLTGEKFVGAFIEPDVTVTNSFNSKVAIVHISAIGAQATIPSNVPFGRSVQGFFTPPFNFVD